MSKSMTYRDALEFASRIIPSESAAAGLPYEKRKEELVTMLFEYADNIWEEYYERYPLEEE